MILIYNPANGEIFNAVWENNKLQFTHSINVPIETFEIDEIIENQIILADLHKSTGRKNEAGLGKYYIANDQLLERQGWEEWIPL